MQYSAASQHLLALEQSKTIPAGADATKRAACCLTAAGAPIISGMTSPSV
jgi:hypothetical protein